MAAPTITTVQVAVAIGATGSLTDTLSAEVEGNLDRLRLAAVELVSLLAPAAPVSNANEAVVRLVGYWHDTDPSEGRGGDAVTRSGAGSVLGRWRRQTLAAPAGSVEAPTDAAASRAALAALAARVAALEASGGGGGGDDQGVDQTARDGVETNATAIAAEEVARAAADTALGVRIDANEKLTNSAGEAAAKAVSDARAAQSTADAALPADAPVLNRIPVDALPAPAMATRGHFLAQAADSETYAFSASQGVQDDQARAEATQAKTDAAAAKTDAAAAKTDAAAAKQQAGDAQHLAEESHASIAALEDGGLLTTGYGDWALWTNDDYHAGFHLATSLTNMFSAQDFHSGSNVFSGVATNRRIAMSVPSGVDPGRVRARRTLSGAETFVPGAGEGWRKFTPTNASRSRDYYYLAVSSSGNHVVTTFAANDRVDLQIRPVVPVMSAGGVPVIARLTRVTHDLIAGEIPAPGWQDVKADGTQGGIAAGASWDLAKAKAANYSAPSLAVSGFPAFIIPAAADPRHYRAIFGTVGTGLLSALRRLGADDDWQYYEEPVSLSGETVKLQLDDRALAHTTFDGILGPKALASIPESAPAAADLTLTKLATIASIASGGSRECVATIPAAAPDWKFLFVVFGGHTSALLYVAGIARGDTRFLSSNLFAGTSIYPVYYTIQGTDQGADANELQVGIGSAIVGETTLTSKLEAWVLS